MRGNSFREKSLRHEKSHCNISIRGWRGERMGKGIRPCLCFLHPSGLTSWQVLWAVSQIQGSLSSAWAQDKQRDFYSTLWSTWQPTGLDSWRKSSSNLPTIPPALLEQTMPEVGFPALLQTTGILGVGGSSQRGLQWIGFHPVSQPCNKDKDLPWACRKDQIPALGLGPFPPLMGRWLKKNNGCPAFSEIFPF